MLILLSLLAAPLAQNPRDAQQLDVGTLAYDPAIVSVDNQSVALWKDGVTFAIYASSSDGRGVNWSMPVRVDDDLTGANKFMSSRCLTMADGMTYAVWRDGRNGDSDAYFARSADGGQSWSTSMRLDDGYAAGDQAVDDLQIVADNQYVYVAMRVDEPGGGESIWMASSMDHGANWNASLKANSVNEDCDYMAITCEDINAFVTWADGRDPSGDDDLYLRMTHNGGTTWMMMMMDEQIDKGGNGTGDVEAPEVLIEGGMFGLVVAWLEDGTATSPSDEELHFLFSPNGGHLWPNPEVVFGSGYDVENPSMAFDGGTIVLAWEDDRTGIDEVYAATSYDYGLTWTEQQISQGGGTYPVVRGQSELWAITYGMGGFPEGTGLSISRDGGTTFLASQDLKAGLGNDTDFNELAYNQLYENFVAVWLDDSAGSNNLFAGGARAQSIAAVSPSFMPGDSLHFEASHFPTSDDGGSFAVIASSGLGSYALPYGDGRNTGLLNNPYLPARLAQLSGSIDASGAGVTPTLTVPNTPGMTWYAVGLSYLQSQTGLIYLQRMTDVIEITVQ